MRSLQPKDGRKRNGVLVFTRFIAESQVLVNGLKARGINAAIVTGDTPKKERERFVKDFKEGKITVVANSGVFTTGFDHPALDTVILARPTNSLSLYYQMCGRAIRPFQGKQAWLLDMCGTYRKFGKVSDLRIECPDSRLRDLMAAPMSAVLRTFAIRFQSTRSHILS